MECAISTSHRIAGEIANIGVEESSEIEICDGFIVDDNVAVVLQRAFDTLIHTGTTIRSRDDQCSDFSFLKDIHELIAVPIARMEHAICGFFNYRDVRVIRHRILKYATRLPIRRAHIVSSQLVFHKYDRYIGLFGTMDDGQLLVHHPFNFYSVAGQGIVAMSFNVKGLHVDNDQRGSAGVRPAGGVRESARPSQQKEGEKKRSDSFDH